MLNALLGRALLALSTLVPLLPAAQAAPQAPAQEVRACWLTQYAYLGKSEGQLRAMADNIKAGNMNTVYVAVYAGAQTLWPSKAYQQAGGQWTSATFDWARHLVRIFHEEGLNVGAWFEYGLAVGPASHPLALAHPDWLARDKNGDPVTGENGGFVFLSPGSAPATDMIVEMVRELAENYDFDDIQLDRFRWGRKSGGREYGYEAPTSALYQATYGTPPPTNVNNSTWVAFREGLVDDVMERCYDVIKAANPGIVVSSAPTGSYGLTQHMQRWDHWLHGGYLDLVLPQMYLTSLSSFQGEFNTQRNLAGSLVDRLGVGYRASDGNDWTVVDAQLDHARASGVAHGALWVYHFYTAVPAIQDEIDNLPLPGNAWAAQAVNPFVDPDCVQVFADDADGAAVYAESGAGWGSSAQADHFAFGSRVASGASLAEASFSLDLPRAGHYDVYAWYTAAANRNPAARYTIEHALGSSVQTVDQRSGGGEWRLIGSHLFAKGPGGARVTVSNAGSAPGAQTSADAIKLVFRDVARTACLAKLNSQGCLPLISWSGTPTRTGPDDFLVRVDQLVSQQFGLFLWGTGAAQIPFQGGSLCVAAPIRRTAPSSSGGSPGPQDCSGSQTFHFSQVLMAQSLLAPGTPVVGQFWTRDTQHPDGTGVGLSGSVQFVIQP